MSAPESLDSGRTLQRHPVPAAAALDAAPTGALRYEHLGVLGEGGMGRVFEAVDRQFSRVVAMKELRDPAADHGRFLTEAMVTGNLEHPGIPPVYERGNHADGAPFYVMRRVRGRSLEEAFADAGELPARMALLPALTRAAQTLGFAHEKGVVHRDVKPQNILVGTHGEVFVVDWGLARVGPLASGNSSGSQGSTLSKANETMAGAVMGTPAYMAPEQARGDVAMIDARTDVFALGAVLYRLLAGKPPYEGASSGEAVARAAKADCPDLDVIAKAAPEPLRTICKKAMAARPEQRFPTAQHLADALEAFANDAVFLAHEPGARRTALLAAVVGGGAGLLGLVSVFQFDISVVFGANVVFGAVFLSISLALAWYEARSRGRLGLGPLGFGLTGAVFLSGIIGSSFRVLNQADADPVKGVASTMLIASLLTTLSLVAWGMVLRKRVR